MIVPDTVSSVNGGNYIPYNRPLYLEPKMRTPPIDYEDPDSGTGDSDHDDRSAASSSGANSTTTGSSVTESVNFCKIFNPFFIYNFFTLLFLLFYALLQYL